MSPMPTPEYEEHLQDLVRKANREGKLTHPAPTDRRSTARSRADLPDPHLLDTPSLTEARTVQPGRRSETAAAPSNKECALGGRGSISPELLREIMKANRAWARVHAPWLLEEWLDG